MLVALSYFDYTKRQRMKRGVTILPVVARELLVASRRKQTYGMRMALAVIAVLATTVTTVAATTTSRP